MSVRKYREYLIKIEHQNGNTETIEYLDNREINNTDYKEMLSVYRDTKEQYEGTPCTILFMGTNGEECIEIFAKTFESEINMMGNATERVVENMTIIKKLLEENNNMIEKSKDTLSLASKEYSEFYHFIESDSENVKSDECKIERYDKIEKLLLSKRKAHNDHGAMRKMEGYLESMGKDCDLILTGISDVKVKVIKCREEIQVKKGVAYDNNSIKRYSYKNFKDRINLMKQLKCKFDKIVNDEENMELCCYIKLYKK